MFVYSFSGQSETMWSKVYCVRKQNNSENKLEPGPSDALYQTTPQHVMCLIGQESPMYVLFRIAQENNN